MHSGESNYSSLSNYFVSAKKRKREWNNGILKFVYLYIYIYSKNPLWLRIISRVKRRFSKVVKLYLLQSKKKKVVKLGPYGQTRLTKNCSPKRFFSPQKPVYMKNSMNCANRGSTSRIWKLWTVVVLPGSVDLEFFFFFWVPTDSTIDEASTSDIEIAILFVLIPLFNLAHILFLRFLPTAISTFSLSLRFFCLLFLQFSASLCFSFEV